MFTLFPEMGCFTKELKNGRSSLWSCINTRKFLTTREKCLEKMASASRGYGLFLIIAKSFDDSTVHEKQLFLLIFQKNSIRQIILHSFVPVSGLSFFSTYSTQEIY